MAVANNNSDNVSILLGAAGGNFTGPTNFATGSFPGDITIGTYNPDSDPDLAVANQGSNDVSILLGGAGGSFGAPTDFPVGASPNGIASANFDGDTDADLATANFGASDVSILLQANTVGFARPKSATPVSVQLVPAFNSCTSSNGTHGAPLALPSCNPPVQSSSYLTLNAPDRLAPYNTTANSTASLDLKVFCTNSQAPPCPATGDQVDVQLSSTITGVRCVAATGNCPAAGDLYNGMVLFDIPLRITDKLNGPSQNESGTVSDTSLQFGAPCGGGSCSTVTTADAVIPGIALEQRRAVWSLGAVQIRDGGPDGDLVAAGPPRAGPARPPAPGMAARPCS